MASRVPARVARGVIAARPSHCVSGLVRLPLSPADGALDHALAAVIAARRASASLDRCCCSPVRSATAWSSGQHLPDVVDWFKDARDAAANSLGFRIAAVSLTGSKEVSREEILTTAGVTGRASLLFLDADAARARLLANPWIADAAVLKLYPDRLQITVTERQAFALWQKDGRVSVIAADGTVLEPFVESR